MRWVILGLALVTAGTIALVGRRGDVSARRPLLFFEDMAFAPRYDPEAAGPFFSDGRSMRTPPAGTVAFGGGDYESDAGSPRQNRDYLRDDMRYYFGKEGPGWAQNPLKIDTVLLHRGQERYTIFCAPCHGATGTGNGVMTQHGMVGVASISDALHRLMPDGQFFDVISHGKGRMASYERQIPVRDRWAIVAYLRVLMRSQAGTEADVPETKRTGANP